MNMKYEIDPGDFHSKNPYLKVICTPSAGFNSQGLFNKIYKNINY